MLLRSFNNRVCTLISSFLICLMSSGCQTQSTKKSSEILNGKEVKTDPSTVIEPGMEDAGNEASSGSGDPSTMWSPATRRVTAMYQFLVAQKLIFNDNVAGAEPYFEAAYNLEPNSFTGARLVRSKILANPKNGKGIDEARRMSLLYPNNADLHLLFGQVLLMADKSKEAETHLKRAIVLNPQLEEAYTTLSKCYQMQNNTEAAIGAVRSLTKANSQSIQGWVILSKILISEKRAKEALEPARRAWELQENNPELALLYALTLDLNHRSKDAVKLYEQLYRFNPGSTELVQRMLNLYKELGSLPSALTLIDDMIENSRAEVPGLKMQKILILWEMRRNIEALKVAEELIAEVPESDRAMYTVGVALVIVGRPEDAIPYFAKIPPESPLKADGMTSHALALKQLGKMDEALELAKTLCSNPNATVENYRFWASLLASDDRFKAGVEVIAEAIQRFPTAEDLIFEKGVYQEKSGDRSGSEVTMRLVIEKNQKDAPALNFVAYLLAEDGRKLEEAEELVRRALVLQPKNGGYLDTLGWIFYQKRDYKLALSTLEKALVLEAEEGVIWEHAGDALLALGNKKVALEKYRAGLKCKNDSKDQLRIQKKIDSISSNKAAGE